MEEYDPKRYIENIVDGVDQTAREMTKRLEGFPDFDPRGDAETERWLSAELADALGDIAEVHREYSTAEDGWPPAPDIPPNTAWFNVAHRLGGWVVLARQRLAGVAFEARRPLTDRALEIAKFIRQTPGKTMAEIDKALGYAGGSNITAKMWPQLERFGFHYVKGRGCFPPGYDDAGAWNDGDTPRKP